MSSNPPNRASLALYLSVLAGSCEAEGFFDVRWRIGSRAMRRRFLSAAETAETAALISSVADRDGVYVGVALRDGCISGGRRAISDAHLVWVESDNPATADLLRRFAHPPTLIVASGTPGHLQLYWCLDRRYPLEQVEWANRALATTFSGDAACADGARILRPPGTLNHKHDPPRRVELLRAQRGTRYSLAQLAGEPGRETSPRHPIDTGAASPRAGRTDLDRALLAIPAEDYVRVLAGLTPNVEGKVLCPFHEDRDPSLQLYGDGSFYCFGSDCRRGGSIYDFASHLWGIPTRGLGFVELSGRLASRFDTTSRACS